MKRPLLLFAAALSVGIITAYASGSYYFVASAILFFLSALFILRGKYPGLLYVMAGMIAFYSAGALEFLLIDGLLSRKFIKFADTQLVLKGYVCSEPEIRNENVRYIVKVSEIRYDGHERKMSAKVLLTTENKGKDSFYEYGSCIEITGKPVMPKGRRNPGGFNHRLYLAQSGISASVFAYSWDILVNESRKGSWLRRAGLAVKHRITEAVERSLPEQQAGLLNGMLIGSREGLSEPVKEAFSDSGLAHLMAVSGANVAFIAAPFLWAFKRMRLGKRVSSLIVMAVLVFFVFITGFEASVLRAVIMAVTVLLGRVVRREADTLTSIAFAALLLLLHNPYNIFNIGFQLSFAAALSIILFNSNISNIIRFRFIPRTIKDVLSVTLSAQLGVLPLTAYHFNKVSLASIISNLLAVPVVEVITVLGMIIAAVGQFSAALSKAIGYINCALLSFILYVSKVTAQSPLAVLTVITPPLVVVALYYALLWFMLYYKPLTGLKLKAVHYTAASAVVFLAVFAYIVFPSRLEVVFLDVGQGDSVFLRTPGGKTVLIDGGGYAGSRSEGSNMGDYAVVPFLLDRGVYSLDAVIATHAHDDHVQGLTAVLESMKVGCFIIPGAWKEEMVPLIDISSRRTIPVKYCGRGDVIVLDKKTCLKVLNPGSYCEKESMSLNNSSLVLKLCYGNTSILLTGDIEQETEDTLLKTGADMKALVLKVAHHGSDTSSTGVFLKNVRPAAAVVSVGANNFGHPSTLVLERLESMGVRVFRTDVDGAVILRSDGKRIEIKGIVENYSGKVKGYLDNEH